MRYFVYTLFKPFFLNVQMAEAASSPQPETPSTLTETEGEMEGSVLDVDLDGYQTTLEEVLTWLLSAEDTLQMQDEVSNDVEEVKDQFHTHEVGVWVFLFFVCFGGNTKICTHERGTNKPVLSFYGWAICLQFLKLLSTKIKL